MKKAIWQFVHDESGFLPALIGAGASLLGGAINRRAERRQQNQAIQSDATRLQTMRADATAAGFNPLTALHATGGGPGPAFFAPSGALGSSIAQAGAMFGDAMQRRTEKRQEQSAKKAIQSQRNLARVNQAHMPTNRGARIFGKQDATDTDYVAEFNLPAVTRPETRSGFLTDAKHIVYHPQGQPMPMTTNQMRLMDAQPGQGVGFDQLYTVFGQEGSEMLGRKPQIATQLDMGAYDPSTPLWPTLQGYWNRYQRFIQTQIDDIAPRANVGTRNQFPSPFEPRR